MFRSRFKTSPFKGKKAKNSAFQSSPLKGEVINCQLFIVNCPLLSARSCQLSAVSGDIFFGFMGNLINRRGRLLFLCIYRSKYEYMASSGSDYLEKRRQQIARKQRIVTYISLLGFGGSILFGGFSTIQKAWQQPQQSVVESAETELEKQIKGYELVLQREPNNQVALEKLSVMKLQVGDIRERSHCWRSWLNYIQIEKTIKLC